MPERIQDVLLALAFLACGGHHILLRLLSLHLCNEYLSLPKKKKNSFQAQLTPSLPASMTQGVITLLYKGKGARSSLDSYRPITLLNSDYKLLAKALAIRLGPALQHVIDPTQTALFAPAGARLS